MPVWLRIVWARRSASTTALDGLADRSRPWSVPRWTISPPTGFWVSSTRNSSIPPPGSRMTPAVADLAAALGVERRPVEDDLGGALAGQLVELRCRRGRSRRRALRRRRLVAEELVSPARAWIARYSATASAWRSELGLLARPAALALLGEGGLEPGPVDGDAVLGGELDGQVDREAERVVEPERDVAGEHSARPAAGPPRAARRPARSSVSGIERRLEQPRAGVERPGELAPPRARSPPRISSRRSTMCG